MEWRDGPYACSDGDTTKCPMYNIKIDSIPSYQSGVSGICRVKDEVGNWLIGLVKKPSWGNIKCCPFNGNSTSVGCNNSYDTKTKYQYLYTGNCITPETPRWTTWSNWSDCDKYCYSGVAAGKRTRSRSCKNGTVGELGCTSTNKTILTEPCNMARVTIYAFMFISL